jgi:hypothetical protein
MTATVCDILNTIDDLRNHLFATLEALQDPEKPMDVERAKAVNQTAQTLINSAKVEVEFIETTGNELIGDFFPRLPRRSQPNNAALNSAVSRPPKLLSANQR